ncbi:MAG: hypothetical protein ABSC94_30525 [Polyangiaceae bacterium]|jgi:hypothetical protein
MATKTAEWPYVVRLSNEEQRLRLARLEQAMCAKLGAAVPRTTVLEAVLARGLDALEPEYGIKAGAKR